MIYVLSCDTIENGGGVYGYDLLQNGELRQCLYFPCDRPMYAVRCQKGLCILLRRPFKDNANSGYFFVDENLSKATEIKNTQGVVACHLCVNNDDVYVANYLSGNIVKNGEIIAQRYGASVHPTRQTEPHTHFVGKMSDGFFTVCDLGTDTLAIYNNDLQLISEVKVPSGYGIRHLVVSKDGKYIYAINELVPSVSIFTYEEGKAKICNTVRINCRNENASGAAIRFSNDGQYLYISLREENVIGIYAVNKEKINLVQIVDCGGENPRDFNIFGEFLICANEKSGEISVFRIKNGLLAELNVKLNISTPLGIL